MKYTILIFTLILAFVGCDKKQELVKKVIVEKTSDTRIKLHKLKKLFVVGDFDGDNKKDTIFQHIYSGVTKKEIENAADPFQNDWDVVVKWFWNQDVDLYLSNNKKNQDTLHLGEAHGLYCLINIGDTNNDGKDEIALVIDYLDYSRVNSCKIYTLCNNKWTLLKKFGIYEDAFDFEHEKPSTFYEIKEYLENKNNKWFYKDYLQLEYDNEDDVGKMIPLKLERCK